MRNLQAFLRRLPAHHNSLEVLGDRSLLNEWQAHVRF